MRSQEELNVGQFEQSTNGTISSNRLKNCEAIFKGNIIVPGSPVYTHISAVLDNRIEVDQFNHSECFDIQSELKRFHEALEHSLEALALLKLKFHSKCNQIEADIVTSQIALISDPFFMSAIEDGIAQRRQRVEQSVAHAMFHLRHAFTSMPGNQFSEKFDDVEDVCYRILSSLNRKKRRKECELLRKLVKDVNRPGILGAVISYSLAPSVASELAVNKVLAVITCQGGAMSHTAVVCRAKGIPYISGVPEDILSNAKALDTILVQPELGTIILHPSLQRLNDCLAQKSILKKKDKVQRDSFIDNPPQKSFISCFSGVELQATPKRQPVEICSTVDGPDEVALAMQYNTSKVGLYRTEYLVFQKRSIPKLEDQIEEYKKCIYPLNGRPIAFRTFDFSSDKSEGELDSKIPALKDERRGISLINAYPHIIKKQLLAIFSAAHACCDSDVRILFPMVASQEMLQKYLSIFSSAWALYTKQYCNEKCISKPKVGIMIELPLAALQISQFKEHIDFICIGTNDLLQYTLAIDRVNNTSPESNYHSVAGHVGFLHIIKYIADQATREQISLCICGELASDPLFIPIFLGFGITSFSVPPRKIQDVYDIVRLCEGEKVCHFASQVLQSSSSQEVVQKAQDYVAALHK